MKKILLIVALIAAGTFALSAQPGMGGPPMGGGMPPMGGMPGFSMNNLTMTQPSPETIKAKTDSMIVDYKLDAEQAEMLLGVNSAYFGKITFPVVSDPLTDMPAAGGLADMFDPRNMNQEDIEQAMQRMQEMQDQAAKMEDNQTAYENALSVIFTKKQMRKFKRDKSQYNNLMRNRMQAEFQSRMGRGFPGGGPGGGGFPGGGPGGF